MREDLREILEKHYPYGFVLVGICANSTMDIETSNHRDIQGLQLISGLSQAVVRDHPEAWRECPPDNQ